MKSRLTTYLLVVAVLAVWGIVGWKVLFAKPDTPATVAVQPTKAQPKAPEGDFLLLDYKAPFRRNAAPAAPTAAPTETPPASVLPPKPAKPKSPPPIIYAGTIDKGGKTSHIFEHAGLLHTISKGDELEGYTLSEIFADSVWIARDGELHTLHIQR